MRKWIHTIALVLIVAAAVNAQSTERFVRIIGNAKHEFVADHVRLNYQVSEIAPNEYKKIEYKPIETSYSEFVQELMAIGISESDIIRSPIAAGNYRKGKIKNYHIDLGDQDKMDQLSAVIVDGVKLTSTIHLYKNTDPGVEIAMSFDAIEDAREKAQNICDEIGMKLGKILNIEDKSSGCCTDLTQSKEPSTTKTYKVTITFELLD